MSDRGLVDRTIWTPLDYDEAWRPFDTRFRFRPDFYEQDAPAIDLPDDCLVVDLSSAFADGAGLATASEAIDAIALRTFVRLAESEPLTALDWQHTAYRYVPGHQALSDGPMAVPVFPDGDYYAHMTGDLRWGTFGHPWQQSLCVWGDELVETLGAELLTWLPRHRHSLR